MVRSKRHTQQQSAGGKAVCYMNAPVRSFAISR